MCKLKKLLDGYRPLCAINQQVLLNRHNKLYLWDITKNTMEYLLTIPRPKFSSILSRIRIFERILRSEPRAAIFFQGIVYISYKSVLYKIYIPGKKILEIHLFKNKNNNPLPSGLVAVEGIKGFDSQVVYGEYWMNDNGASIAIYADKDGWQKVYEFPPNTIRHIHAIVPDKYRDCVWILTGDSNAESGFWKATNNFRDVEPVLCGRQNYRSCCAHIYPDGLLFATDSPDEQNSIYKLKEVNNGYQLEKITNIGGSCIYSQQTSRGSYFSTVVEFDNNIEPNWLTWLSYRRGAAIKSWYSDLIYLSSNGEIDKVEQKFRKDLWPMRLCRYSAIEFCYVKQLDVLLIYFIAVSSYDNKIYIIQE